MEELLLSLGLTPELLVGAVIFLIVWTLLEVLWQELIEPHIPMLRELIGKYLPTVEDIEGGIYA